MKFQFNLTEQTLKLVHQDHFIILTQPFYTLGGIGFALDYSEPPQRWIIFSIKQEKVRAVYKNSGTYYQREVIRPASGIVEVEFSEWDRVEKSKKTKN